MSTTTNYSLELPQKGQKDWNTHLNGNFTKIDAEIHKNASNIGDITQLSESDLVEAIKNDRASLADMKTYNANAKNPVLIPTYDGSNQLTHPKILYFPNGWNGYKYWMTFTPYPSSNDDYENPSVVCSNTGYEWAEPSGIVNPVTGAPVDVQYGGHYSDPHLVMNGNIMELWYRYNPANAEHTGVDNSISKIYRMTSTNGVNWSAPQLIFDNEINGVTFNFYSPVILFEDGKYKVWFTSWESGMHYTESIDCITWTNPQNVNLSINGYTLWHQDIIKTDLGYEMVVCAYPNGKFSENIQELFYSLSTDGMNWSTPIKIVSPSKGTGLDNQEIYRSTLLKINGLYKLFYTGVNTYLENHVFLSQGYSMTALMGFDAAQYYNLLLYGNLKLLASKAVNIGKYTSLTETMLKLVSPGVAGVVLKISTNADTVEVRNNNDSGKGNMIIKDLKAEKVITSNIDGAGTDIFITSAPNLELKNEISPRFKVTKTGVSSAFYDYNGIGFSSTGNAYKENDMHLVNPGVAGFRVKANTKPDTMKILTDDASKTGFMETAGMYFNSDNTAIQSVEGAMRYNFTTHKHQGYNGTSWVDLY